MHKILIIRLSSIGDIILSSAFIRQTKKRFPSAQIDFMIKKRFADLVRFNPHLENVVEIDDHAGLKELNKYRKNLDIKHYDAIFDIHNNFRSRILTSGQSAKRYIIKKDKIKRFIYVKTKINLYSEIKRIPYRYLDVGAQSGVVDDKQGLDLFWDKTVEKNAHKKIIQKDANLNNDYICISPGATYETKRWPLDYFVEFTQLINNKNKYSVFVLGGKQDKILGKRLEKEQGVTDFTGELSLLESAYILSKSRVLITNDSGLMHMSAAVKTPLVTIFGSTVRELGFFPFRTRSIILENNYLKCRPCSHLGKKKCPKTHFKCMKEIKPDAVIESMKKLLN